MPAQNADPAHNSIGLHIKSKSGQQNQLQKEREREREKYIQVGERDSKEMRFLNHAKPNQIEPY